MSMILDALKKSEAERKVRQGERTPGEAMEDSVGSTGTRRPLYLAMVLVAMLGLLGALKFWPQSREPISTESPVPDSSAKPIESKPRPSAKPPDPAPSPVEPAGKPKTGGLGSEPQSETKEASTASDVNPPLLVKKPGISRETTPAKEISLQEPEKIATDIRSIPGTSTPRAAKADQDAPTISAPTEIRTETDLVKVPQTPTQSPPYMPPRKPDSPRHVGESLSFDDHINKAAALERDNDLAGALTQYSAAINKNPENAQAFYARGWVHQSNGDGIKALADFSRSVELAPESTDAFFARAWVYEQAGDIDRATTDYSKVISLNSRHHGARLSRGYLTLYHGDAGKAGEDFQEVYKKADPVLSDFGLLWLFVSRIKEKQRQAVIRRDFSNIKPLTKWPGVLVNLITGRAQVDDVLRAISNAQGPDRRKRECAGYFYLGQFHLGIGDQVGARAFFQRAIDSGVTDYRQYWAAKMELDKLSGLQ